MNAEEALKEIQKIVDPTLSKTPQQIVEAVKQLSKGNQVGIRYQKQSLERVRRYRQIRGIGNGPGSREEKKEKRRSEIFSLLEQGASTKEIAGRLGISLGTVYRYINATK